MWNEGLNMAINTEYLQRCLLTLEKSYRMIKTVDEVSIDLINDFDLQVVSKRKLTPSLQRSLNDEYYISSVLCSELFPELHSLDVQRFNADANSRFS